MAKVAKKLCNFRLPETVIGLIKQMADDDKKSQAEIVQEAVTLLASGRTFGLESVRLPDLQSAPVTSGNQSTASNIRRMEIVQRPIRKPLLKPKDRK